MEPVLIVCPGLSFRLSPEHSPLFQGVPGDGRSSYSDARELLTVISLVSATRENARRRSSAPSSSFLQQH